MDQQWYYFNDEQVSKLKKVEQVVSADAYILFYTKTSVESFLRQTLSMPTYWPHVVAAALHSVRAGNDRNSKARRKRLKEHIKSLKSSLSSFAQQAARSGGGLNQSSHNMTQMEFASNQIV